MFEFNGKISGVAEKHMWKESRITDMVIMTVGTTFTWPLVILVWQGVKSSMGFNILAIPISYALISYVMIPLLIVVSPYIMGEKGRIASTPVKVFSDDEYIVCIYGDGNESYRNISNAKALNDYGEFYEICFNGKKEKFLCQKNLLTKGTIKEFEALFEGKIVRK